MIPVLLSRGGLSATNFEEWQSVTRFFLFASAGLRIGAGVLHITVFSPAGMHYSFLDRCANSHLPAQVFWRRIDPENNDREK